MNLTKWPARLVSDKYLCGRQVDGRYVCQGEIAQVDNMSPEKPGVPWGMQKR